MKNKLDFVIVGVQKSATTWLYDCLKHHPDLDLKNSKDEQYYYGGPAFKNKGENWYWEKYKHDGGLKGCVSVEYMEDRSSPQKLLELNPAIKVFISLRDPIHRAISAYYWYYRKSLIENLSIEEAFEKAIYDHMNSKNTVLSELITRSVYADKIANYVNQFGASHVFPLLYEDIKQEPRRVLSYLFKALNVNEYLEEGVFDSRPKQNSYNKWLLRSQRLSGSKFFGKVFDILNQLYCRVTQKKYQPELSDSIMSYLRTIFDEDRMALKSMAETYGWDNLRKLDDIWQK